MHRQLFAWHPLIGHRYVAGLRARVPHEVGGYLVRVNGAGFRSNREAPAAGSIGASRIFVCGDSFMAGDGVDNEERCSDLLETLLPGVEAHNFAIPGTGTDQQYLIYREFAARLPHDLVIAAVFVENIARNMARVRLWGGGLGSVVALPKPYFSLEDGATLTLHGVPVGKHPITLGRDERRPADWSSAMTAYERPDTAGWLLMRAILLRWQAEARAPMVVMPIPLADHIDGALPAEPYQTRFAELCETPGLFVHDPLPDLRRLSPDERRALRFPNDPHLTPAGHRALARSLAPVLGAMLPPGG